MKLSFWSDEDRLFVFWGLGASLNFKFVAKKLGFIKTPSSSASTEEITQPERNSHSPTDRLRKHIEASKYEEKR